MRFKTGDFLLRVVIEDSLLVNDLIAVVLPIGNHHFR